MKNLSVAVVDYDCGNIHSASKALELAMYESTSNGTVSLTNDPDKIISMEGMIIDNMRQEDKHLQALSKIAG